MPKASGKVKDAKTGELRPVIANLYDNPTASGFTIGETYKTSHVKPRSV